MTVEDLPRDFKMVEKTAFPQFRENKYGILNGGLQQVHATLLKNLVQNPESQSTGSISFIQGMCFAIIPFIFLIRTVVTILVKQVKMVHRYYLSF